METPKYAFCISVSTVTDATMIEELVSYIFNFVVASPVGLLIHYFRYEKAAAR